MSRERIWLVCYEVDYEGPCLWEDPQDSRGARAFVTEEAAKAYARAQAGPLAEMRKAYIGEGWICSMPCDSWAVYPVEVEG